MMSRSLTALMLAALALSGCSAGAGDGTEPSTPLFSGSVAPPPALTASPSAFPVDLPTAADWSEDVRWDDWSEELPRIEEKAGLIRLVRFDFANLDAIRAHVRVALDEQTVQEGGVEFCDEGELTQEFVGFGDHWSAAKTVRDGYVVCDTTATFSLDEWGGDGFVPKPVVADDRVEVDLSGLYGADPAQGLFRLRMEFAGPVLEASENARVTDNSVTWFAPGNAKVQARK